MPQYEFWYTDNATYKAGFEADNLEEAREMLEKVFSTHELFLDELPDFWQKHKNGEYDYSPETLEEY